VSKFNSTPTDFTLAGGYTLSIAKNGTDWMKTMGFLMMMIH